MSTRLTLDDYRDIDVDTDIAKKKYTSSPGNIQGTFVQKMPMEHWLKHAYFLPGKTIHVAILLQYVHGLAKGQDNFTVQTKLLKEYGIDRRSYNKALKLLMEAGLISVDSHKGRKARITILDISH